MKELINDKLYSEIYYAFINKAVRIIVRKTFREAFRKQAPATSLTVHLLLRDSPCPSGYIVSILMNSCL